LSPIYVDVLRIIEKRAIKYYGLLDNYKGYAFCGDSREKSTYQKIPKSCKIRWIITSPPYYGMRTYISDQWLRNWFIGGKASVEYSKKSQIVHSNKDFFSAQLNKVWTKTSNIAEADANLIIRFGGINDRKADSLKIIKQSLKNSGWKISKIQSAGFSSSGKRQALHFSKFISPPREEYDIWAVKL
jgi:hypothetical protein